MTRAQLQGSRTLWRVRYRWRLRRWRFWHSRYPQTARTVAGRRKWWKLLTQARLEIAHSEAQLAALPKPKPSTRSLALAWAASKVGVSEHGGANRGPQVDEWERRFGFLGVPWCGIFAGNALLHAGVKGVTSRIASVAAIESDATAHHGPFRGFTQGSANGALQGDLVCLFAPGEHVEVIRQVNGDGSVLTYGGNYSNQVVAGARAAHSIVGVAHVNYP